MDMRGFSRLSNLLLNSEMNALYELKAFSLPLP